MLLIEPLIGAIAAGNCAVLKPSEFAPNTANVIEKIIKECFEEDYVTVIQGDKDVSQALIEKNFDYIFYKYYLLCIKSLYAFAISRYS